MTPSSPKTGLLLINLGTPDAPTTAAVRRYLREFLSDPKVIDIHPVARSLLLNLIILPFRSPKSAHAYRAIWRDDGSPLLHHSIALTDAVRNRLATRGVSVELGMRYGNPSLSDALERLREAGCERVVAFPLYPQRADSSTGSTEAKLASILDRMKRAAQWEPTLDIVAPFFDRDEFIHSFATVTQQVIDEFAPDHLLFSFHGIPERHVRQADPTRCHCQQAPDCCVPLRDANRDCYRAQCYATAESIAQSLALPPTQWSVAFQSRLGRTPWIRPYTDVEYVRLAQQGVRRLAILCPAFVADCLETLEEIGIRADADFRAAGGEELRLVPSLNATPQWVDGVVSIASSHIP